MWFINIQHWLDETKTGPAVTRLRLKVKKLAEIITYATSAAAGMPTDSYLYYLGSDQAKLFKYKKKYFKNSRFLGLECYFWYQKRPHKKYGSAQIGLKRSFSNS